MSKFYSIPPRLETIYVEVQIEPFVPPPVGFDYKAWTNQVTNALCWAMQYNILTTEPEDTDTQTET